MAKAKSREAKIADRQVGIIESYQRAFSGPAGEAVLFDLIQKHWVLGSTKVQADVNEMIFREGERNVVLRILTLLKVDPRNLRERIEAHAKEME